MAKDKDEVKDAPKDVAPEVPARRYVEVECISVEGYVKGARTTLHVVRAEELAKLGKLKILGDRKDKTNKKAPAGDPK